VHVGRVFAERAERVGHLLVGAGAIVVVIALVVGAATAALACVASVTQPMFSRAGEVSSGGG
jgi:hypothetical protein